MVAIKRVSKLVQVTFFFAVGLECRAYIGPYCVFVLANFDIRNITIVETRFLLVII